LSLFRLGGSLSCFGVLRFEVGLKLLVLVVELLLLLEVPRELILSDKLLDSCLLHLEFFNSGLDSLKLSVLGCEISSDAGHPCSDLCPVSTIEFQSQLELLDSCLQGVNFDSLDFFVL